LHNITKLTLTVDELSAEIVVAIFIGTPTTFKDLQIGVLQTTRHTSLTGRCDNKHKLKLI